MEETRILQLQATNSHRLPCDLFIVIAKAKRIENCILLKGKVDSDGVICIQGNRTTSPLNFPVNIVASNTFPVILLMTILMYRCIIFGGFRLRNRPVNQFSGEDCV